MAVSMYVVLIGASTLAAVAVNGQPFRRTVTRPALMRILTLVPAAIGLAASAWCLLAREHAGQLGSAIAAGSFVALSAAGGLALSMRLPARSTRLPRRVLVIGAHPDDLELACGATIAKLADSGHEVRALVMTQGGSGGDPRTRMREAVTAGGFLGITTVDVLDLPDTRLAGRERDLVVAIERAVSRFNPDIILTHSGNDQHMDHRAVHLATLQAARRHPAILSYESPSATAAFDPRLFVDVEHYLDVKVAAISAHADQRGKPYMAAEQVRAGAAFRGSQAKVRLAEAFEPVRIVDSIIGDL